MTPDCPLRPRFVLPVGVTGHRPNKLIRPGPVVPVIERCLATLERVAIEAHALRPEYFSGEPAFSLLSPLAPGADILVAEAAARRGWDVDAILPFVPDRSRKDAAAFGEEAVRRFDTMLEGARTVFSPPPWTLADAQGYRDCGRRVLDHAAVVLAIWDGDGADGIGGTAEIVAEARGRGLVVIGIAHDGSQPPRLAPVDADVPFPDWPVLDDAELKSRTGAALLPPDDPRSLACLRTFYGTRERRRTRALAYSDMTTACQPLSRSMKGRLTKLVLAFALPVLALAMLARSVLAILGWPSKAIRSEADALESDWHHSLAETSRGDAAWHARFTLFASRWARADNAAVVNGTRYRSAYVLVYTLSAFAIAISLLSLLRWDDYAFKAALVGTELVVAGIILALVYGGRRKGTDWHRRFIDYRNLAETMRGMRNFALIGGNSGRGRSARNPSQEWPFWYAEACARELGPRPTVFSTRSLGRTLATIRDDEIGIVDPDETAASAQYAYHRANFLRLRRIDRVLHIAGERFFIATIVVAATYLLVYFLPIGKTQSAQTLASGAVKPLYATMKPTVTFICAALPAAAAAINGIRAQGEFRSLVERSRRTAQELEALRAAVDRGLAGPTLDLQDAVRLVSALEHVIAEDHGVWSIVYLTRALDLPG